MDRVILQVPMSKSLKEKAEAVARDEGFSSVQEIVRLILNKIAKKQISVSITAGEVIKLSPVARRRYKKIEEDIQKGRHIHKATDVDDFLKQLRS